MSVDLPACLSATVDKSTLSNPASVRVSHIHWAVAVDFDARRVAGRAELSCTVLEAGAPALLLDSRALHVTGVSLNGDAAVYNIGAAHAAFGSAISVECVRHRCGAAARR